MRRNPAARHGNGAGWGGPKKGAGKGGEAKAFTAESLAPHLRTPALGAENRFSSLPRDERGHVVLSDKRAQAEARAEQLKDKLYDLALNAQREADQKAAAEAWLNRHEGMPVARNINANVDDISKMSDEALRATLQAELDRLNKALH